MDIYVIYFVSVVIISVGMFYSTKKIVDHFLYLPFVLLQLLLTLHELVLFTKKVEGKIIPYFDNELFIQIRTFLLSHESSNSYFKVDGVGLLFLVVLTVISITTIIHSIIFTNKLVSDTDEIWEAYNGSLVLLIATMSGALLTNNIGLMWAFIEATTLCSSMLIFHNRDRAALEAAWKYIFVSSIAISLAFVGILFLGIAAQDNSHIDLTIDILTKVAPKMELLWLKLSFLLIVTGYSVKMGIVPLFTVDIDAKDAAPAQIGALFSGGLMNVGFVAIFRFYEIFATTEIYNWMNNVMMIIGFSSLLFAAVYLLRVRNLKRMLAYSSVEHAGLVLIGLSCGNVGYWAMIYHLMIHSFVKSSLFYQVGHIYRLYKNPELGKIGNYIRIHPLGGTIILLGFISVIAIPPSGLFLSEIYIFKSIFLKGHYYIGFSVLFLLTLIIYGMAKNFLKLLFYESETTLDLKFGKVHYLEVVTQVFLLGFVFMMGVYPPKEIVSFIQYTVHDLTIMVHSLPN